MKQLFFSVAMLAFSTLAIFGQSEEYDWSNLLEVEQDELSIIGNIDGKLYVVDKGKKKQYLHTVSATSGKVLRTEEIVLKYNNRQMWLTGTVKVGDDVFAVFLADGVISYKDQRRFLVVCEIKNGRIQTQSPKVICEPKCLWAGIDASVPSDQYLFYTNGIKIREFPEHGAHIVTYTWSEWSGMKEKQKQLTCYIAVIEDDLSIKWSREFTIPSERQLTDNVFFDGKNVYLTSQEGTPEYLGTNSTIYMVTESEVAEMEIPIGMKTYSLHYWKDHESGSLNILGNGTKEFEQIDISFTGQVNVNSRFVTIDRTFEIDDNAILDNLTREDFKKWPDMYFRDYLQLEDGIVAVVEKAQDCSGLSTDLDGNTSYRSTPDKICSSFDAVLIRYDLSGEVVWIREVDRGCLDMLSFNYAKGSDGIYLFFNDAKEREEKKNLSVDKKNDHYNEVVKVDYDGNIVFRETIYPPNIEQADLNVRGSFFDGETMFSLFEDKNTFQIGTYPID